MPKVQGMQHYNFKHGRSGTKLHFIWIEMRQRCENPKHKHFNLYGQRGIRVCASWHDFTVFYTWAIQNGYEEGLSIERKDNDGNYEPQNCKWATQKEQTNNTRRSKMITYNGETKSLSLWASSLDLNYRTLRSRLRIGWNPDIAFNLSTGKRRNQYSNLSERGTNEI